MFRFRSITQSFHVRNIYVHINRSIAYRHWKFLFITKHRTHRQRHQLKHNSSFLFLDSSESNTKKKSKKWKLYRAHAQTLLNYTIDNCKPAKDEKLFFFFVVFCSFFRFVIFGSSSSLFFLVFISCLISIQNVWHSTHAPYTFVGRIESCLWYNSCAHYNHNQQLQRNVLCWQWEEKLFRKIVWQIKKWKSVLSKQNKTEKEIKCHCEYCDRPSFTTINEILRHTATPTHPHTPDKHGLFLHLNVSHFES